MSAWHKCNHEEECGPTSIAGQMAAKSSASDGPSTDVRLRCAGRTRRLLRALTGTLTGLARSAGCTLMTLHAAAARPRIKAAC